MKILLWDIETSPMVVTSWGLYKPELSHDNILKESTLICAAWKLLGDKKVSYAAVDPKAPENDKLLIEALYEALSNADALVAHNGDEFDIRKFNARAIHWGLAPLPPIPTIDTLKVAKQHFYFNSNRLDYLGKFLGLGRKKETGGYGLWLRVMAGDKKALAQMVEYNKQDVLLLEQVYLKLRPYMKNHPNENLHTAADCCPVCGSKEFKKDGLRYTRTAAYQRYECLKCRSWFSDGERTAKARMR